MQIPWPHLNGFFDPRGYFLTTPVSSCSNPRALGCGEFQILLCSHPFILPAKMSTAMILVKRYQEKAFSKAYLR